MLVVVVQFGVAFRWTTPDQSVQRPLQVFAFSIVELTGCSSAALSNAFVLHRPYALQTDPTHLSFSKSNLANCLSVLRKDHSTGPTAVTLQALRLHCILNHIALACCSNIRTTVVRAKISNGYKPWHWDRAAVQRARNCNTLLPATTCKRPTTSTFWLTK